MSNVWDDDDDPVCKMSYPAYTFYDNTCKDPHPFDDVTLIEPYLQQNKYWCDKNRNYIEIKDMDAAYALNALRLLIRKAPDLLVPLSLLKGEEKDEKVDFAEGLIVEYPLAKALVERVRASKETKYPWEKAAAKKKK